MTEDAFRIVSAAAVGLAALAFAVQAGILIALYCVCTKTQRVVTKFIDDVKPLLADAGTALSTASQIMDEARHPIKEVVVDAVTIARSSRQQVRQLGDLLHYVDEHARTRLEQIDSTVASAVARVEHVVNTVNRAVVKPLKEVNGLVAGISAAVSILIDGFRKAGGGPDEASAIRKTQAWRK